MKLIKINSLIVFLVFLIASSQTLAWDIYECEKNLLMSTLVGVKKGNDGYYWIAYEDGNQLSQWREWGKEWDDILKEKIKPDWKYPKENVAKADGLITAFMRQPGYPKDFHSIVLDTVNGVVFYTVKQSSLKYTTSGNCKQIVSNNEPI